MDHEARWQQEAEFFDNETYRTAAMPQSNVERYLKCQHPYTPSEYPYAALGDVRGKRLFEIGCGDGSNAVLFALRGAGHVVGVDISKRAIECAQRLAEMHGVADRCEFVALPLEKYLERELDRGLAKFDVIYGFGILHHLIPVLDSILADLARLAGDQTEWIFTEPASPHWLRKVRLALPIKTVGTPDERPLEAPEFAIVRKYVPNLRLRAFLLFSRIWQRIMEGPLANHQSFAVPVYMALCRLDWTLLAIPGIRSFGGLVAIHGRGAPSIR
jgi:SAM-dependent methyltransferase